MLPINQAATISSGASEFHKSFSLFQERAAKVRAASEERDPDAHTAAQQKQSSPRR